MKLSKKELKMLEAQETVRVTFDRVERQKLAQIKEMKPEYADLNLAQVARMELRYRLFEEVGRLSRGPGNGFAGI